MLKLLFGRYSRVVRVVEALAVVLAGTIVYRWTQTGWQTLPDFLFALLLLHYVFIRLCYLISWYPGVKSQDPAVSELGIEIHFLKALVPTSYILCLSSLLFLLGLEWPVTVLANLMMIVVSGVNGLLIWFHLHDHDSLPVNYFTRELIVSDESVMLQQTGHKKHVMQIKRSRPDQRSAA